MRTIRKGAISFGLVTIPVAVYPATEEKTLRFNQIHEEDGGRIRMKRTQIGLTGAELAQRADISPSYVSLIEKGAKVPDEDVAARIARALRDDEDLYRAWARASRLGLHKLTLLNRMEAISRSPSSI